MRPIRTFAWLPVVCSFAALQACGSSSSDGGSQSGAGAVGTSGAPSSQAGAPANAGAANGAGSPGSAGAGGSLASAGASGSGAAGGALSGGAGGTSSAGSGNSAGAAGSNNPGGKSIGEFVMTWYSFQDNTPVNSIFSASGRTLIPYVSIAVPFTQLKGCAGITTNCTGTLNYGDKLYIAFLDGRVMPNGMKHTGWVELDDYCGDADDDSYCYQTSNGKKYPNTDLYIGDFSKSGMAPTANGDDCVGPAGSGAEPTDVQTGNPGALFISDYGGSTIGTGKCGDQQAARDQQFGPPKGSKQGSTTACWAYDDQDSASDCSMCKAGVTCAP